jgi:hypothetical protein
MVCCIVCRRLRRRTGYALLHCILIDLLTLSNSLFLRSPMLMRILKVKTIQRRRLDGGVPTATTTGNDAEVEAPVAEVSVMKVLESNAAEIPESVEIPHQSEV